MKERSNKRNNIRTIDRKMNEGNGFKEEILIMFVDRQNN